jgi:hypothetical protein
VILHPPDQTVSVDLEHILVGYDQIYTVLLEGPRRGGDVLGDMDFRIVELHEESPQRLESAGFVFDEQEAMHRLVIHITAISLAGER